MAKREFTDEEWNEIIELSELVLPKEVDFDRLSEREIMISLWGLIDHVSVLGEDLVEKCEKASDNTKITEFFSKDAKVNLYKDIQKRLDDIIQDTIYTSPTYLMWVAVIGIGIFTLFYGFWYIAIVIWVLSFGGWCLMNGSKDV